MKCPYFVDEQSTGTTTQCFAANIPFEPSSMEQLKHCTSSRHRLCSLYRYASRDLSLAIHREVARAIG
jgi:hypothetical protein